MLSPWYTVHIASRRGRGRSHGYPENVVARNALLENGIGCSTQGDKYGVYNPEFTAAVLRTEISDLNTLVNATGAVYLIACSSGALISLEALLTLDLPSPGTALQKAIIFEPPAIFLDDEDEKLDLSSLSRFEAESAQGDAAGALVTAMSLVQLGPSWIPRWIMKPSVNMICRSQEKAVRKAVENGEEGRGNCTMKGLGSVLRYDFAVVEASMRKARDYTRLSKVSKVEILLLTGSKSPHYLKQAIATLHQVTKAKNVAIDGVGHELLCGPEMRGQPEKSLQCIRQFLH